MLVASVILMSWRVIRRVTTGASLRVFGECDAVTTTGSISMESRMSLTGGVCANILIAGMDKAMPTKRMRENRFAIFVVTTYFFIPVNDPLKANGMLPYFNIYVTTTVLPLNRTTKLVIVYAFSAPSELITVPV